MTLATGVASHKSHCEHLPLVH